MGESVVGHRTQVHNRIHEAIQEIRADIVKLSLDLHRHPELSLQEYYASERLTDWLVQEGFEVERGVADLPTAFVARRGTKARPAVAFLLEYDALPDIGHACGHNLIASGGLAAATALRRALPDPSGSIVVIGTPGEEDGGGKIIELEKGVFDGIDAALMFHPGDRTIPWRHATATAHLVIKYHGKAAHAASNPQEGRNALAAMIQFYVAVDGLRQHIPETARIHGIIVNGGSAPNVVPDYTEASFLVRALTTEEVFELVDRVTACAQAAALATGTTVEVEHGSPIYAERKNNHTIASRVSEYLEALGEPVEIPVLKGGTGSSDIGNVSLVLPTIHPYLKIAPLGTSGHTHEFREAAASPEAHEAMLHMAEALAKTGADLLLDPSFLEKVWEEFRTSGPDLPQ
ncbi:M20 family metallopeptidase [Alicyclobacillus pomorum]|uniref:M20 family metallopeptidase n=1 Tax=Alicyclobacillus pomorum TaxID=204470 RepID=UPI001B7FA691|nr:M20 family metallopeptidase [Alicyclobacillus pomorum]